MGIKIIYSNLSKTDLKEIYDYISRDSVFYAKREITLIKQAIKSLKLNIFGGRKFKKFDSDLTREMIFKNYNIIYDITNDHGQIEIITIHHHSRSLGNNPAFKIED